MENWETAGWDVHVRRINHPTLGAIHLTVVHPYHMFNLRPHVATSLVSNGCWLNNLTIPKYTKIVKLFRCIGIIYPTKSHMEKCFFRQVEGQETMEEDQPRGDPGHSDAWRRARGHRQNVEGKSS